MPVTGARRALLLVTVVVAGSATMGLELAGIRLLAPWYGSSVYVWGAMIGVILVALALGYGVGGRLADRADSDVPLFAAMLGAGVWQLAALLSARPTLAALSSLGEISGPAVASVVLFVVPMALLAGIAPFVVRLLASDGDVGRASGTVSALSTMGGVVGIALTSFWMLPTLGTSTSLALWCGLTLCVGVFGLAAASMAASAALGLLGVLPFAVSAQAPDGTVWSGESAYNQVHVVQKGGKTALLLNAEWSMHSLTGEDGWSGRYYDDFALGPLLVESPRTALVLGMGAGASLGPMWAAAPQLQIDAVEIDPVVVQAAARFFRVSDRDPRLDVHVADARPWLARQDGRWHLIQIDLYHGGPHVPFYLATREFYGQVRGHLAPGGVVMLNVFDVHPELPLLHGTAATLQTAFDGPLLVLHRPSGNHTVLAFAEPRDLADVQRALAGAGAQPQVQERADKAARALRALHPPADARVFTDDLAPIETLTRQMFLSLQENG